MIQILILNFFANSLKFIPSVWSQHPDSLLFSLLSSLMAADGQVSVFGEKVVNVKAAELRKIGFQSFQQWMAVSLSLSLCSLSFSLSLSSISLNNEVIALTRIFNVFLFIFQDPNNVYIGRDMSYYVPGAKVRSISLSHTDICMHTNSFLSFYSHILTLTHSQNTLNSSFLSFHHSNFPFSFSPPQGSKWQNPFPVKKYGLQKCLELFEDHLLSSPSLLSSLHELKGKVCFDGEPHNLTYTHTHILTCCYEFSCFSLTSHFSILSLSPADPRVLVPPRTMPRRRPHKILT